MQKTTRILFITFSLMIENVLANEVETRVNCIETGFTCESCSTSYYCGRARTRYVPVKVEDCLEGSHCLAETGKCSTDPNPACNWSGQEFQFKCHYPGMYPDPFDCTKYHICTGDQPGDHSSTEHQCPEGFAYNYLELVCNVEMGPQGCTPLMKECTRPGEIGRVGKHEHMFYVCTRTTGLKAYPELSYCYGETVFVNGICQVRDDGLENGLCRGEGKFYNDLGCTYYTECAGAGQEPDTKRCTCGSKYDAYHEDCVPYTCEF